ncbi:hypothetical protein NV379_02545 [Paenibacillus sp. N1-5-1-14]|uniref:hypothetical protein n=1 Tax=Paenibacillus radicibacter TaxID=2972488 RepID=UPI002158B652|nr:hypothetical protein [Paenibacillus radicibacter]MCR8641526.1 hypothetical protein [Paenibacillus radicibacter]
MVAGNVGFIKFYNCFMENGDYKLTPREWYFYSLLAARWSPFTNVAETTVSVISNVQKVFLDKSRPTRDKSNTWEQICNLESKGVIRLLEHIANDGGRCNYDQTLTISFMDLGGFQKITHKLVCASENPIELFFLSVLTRFTTLGFSHSVFSLSELFVCSESRVQEIVKEMKNKNLITYIVGKRFRKTDGQYASKTNTYFLNDQYVNKLKDNDITPNAPENDKQMDDIGDRSTKNNKFEDKITVFGEITMQEILKKKDHSNWGKKINKGGKDVGARINESDIDILLTLQQFEIEEGFCKKYLGILNSWVNNGDMDSSDIEKWIANYHNKMKVKRENWERKKKEESIVNAVVIDGEVLKLDKNNVGQIDFSKADEVYYFDDNELKKGDIMYLAGTHGVTDHMRTDAIAEYKKNVVLGNKLDIEIIENIRSTVKSKIE